MASRLKESGKRVYGFGEKKTPRPFVAACDRFIYTEVFTRVEGQAEPQRKKAEELDRYRASSTWWAALWTTLRSTSR
jgi:hypothetical protein